MKNFAVPFYNRKAILRNNYEEIKIINKFINQGKRNAENEDYFNDLIHYRKYAYVNFKDFDKYGFSNHFNKTVTSVRAVNFDTTSDFKQTNNNNKLQLRVGSKDGVGNVVGLMIPSNVRALQCIKLSEVINIRDLSKKSKNGFSLFLNFVKQSMIKGEPHNSSVFWIFDPELDRFKTDHVESKESVTKNDIVKAMIAEFYNRIVTDIYHEIIDQINLQKEITLDQASKIISYLEKMIGIPISQDIYEDIEKYVFERKIAGTETDDILINDTLYGLEGDTIELPTYSHTQQEPFRKLTVDLSHIDISGKFIEAESVEGVCQHNITWDNINIVRKTDYSEYMRLLYNFIQQYVIENTHQDYVCKSCGFYLDIKKYIQDGTFDDEKGFVTFSMPMEVNLEDIPEYEKYQFSIKIMDKNIEKIASSVGIPYFVGNTTTVKWRRKGIIKNTIDMVTQNNQLLAKVFKDRNENKTKTYGVSKALSNLFIFDMENNIFQTSSKDKDQEQFKMIKRNNITTYVLIYLILELNESQISFFTSDKKNMCDIRIFDKIYNTLFGGLRIKKNSAGDTVDLTKYKILCYLIYMISCRIAKHKLWYSPQTTEKNVQKMIPIIQRFIVHTCIDLINSILENSFQTGVSYIFEIFRVRFYSKLNTIFKDDEYYNLLLEQSNFSYITAKRRAHLKLVPNDSLPPYIYDPPKWRIHVPAKFYPKYLIKDDTNLNGISNLTNCPDGEFHKWTLKNGSLSCTKCEAVMKNLKYNESEASKIIDKYKLTRLNLLAQKFCSVDGELHQYVYDSETKKNICIKCKKSDDNKYTSSELDKIEKMIDNINAKRKQKYIDANNEYLSNDEKDKSYVQSVVSKNLENFKSEYDKENPFKFIDNFIDALQGVIGNEIKGEYPIYLRNNTYIIDHDHLGHDLGGNEIIITEADNKIFHKANHPFFKTDVIYYTDKSGARVDVFYDTITRKLLGYKEVSKDFVAIKKTDKKIKINYSIYNKLKLMGYTGQYIDISDEVSKIKSDSSDNEKQFIYRHIVKDISTNRIENIKRTILEFQRIFNRILNNYSDKIEKPVYESYYDKPNNKSNDKPNDKSNDKTQNPSFDPKFDSASKHGFDRENTTYFSEKMNSLVDKYRKKIKDINIKESSGKHQIFKHWKGLCRGIFVDDFDDKYFNFDSELIESDLISRYDSQSNILLYFMIHEFTQLLKYNSNGFIKTNISNFLVEFIDRAFSRYNTEYLYINTDINRFMHILNSVGFMRELEEQGDNKTQGFYDEYVEDEEQTEDDIERQIDDSEEQDALDVDMDNGDMEEGVISEFDRFTDWELSD